MIKFISRWLEILGIIFVISVFSATFTTIMMKVYGELIITAITEKLGIILVIGVCLATFTTIMMKVFGELTTFITYVMISIIMSGISIYIFPL